MTAGERDGMVPDVVMIGCGNMGSSLAAGYHARVPDGQLLVVDRNVDRVRATLPSCGRVRVVRTIAEIGQVCPGMTLLAIKPQAMAAVLPLVAALPAARGLVVSIAAGTSIASIRGTLPAARVVRAMPNTPASVGSGATGIWCGEDVTAQDRSRCEALFDAVGLTRWVSREEDLDAVTAVSGSGPAYLFAVVEALAQAGVDAGLEKLLADELARATVIGAAAMLKQSPAGPDTLKAAVRSQGGTTDAALRVFEGENALALLFCRAVAAAHARAKDLGQQVNLVTSKLVRGPTGDPASIHNEGIAPHA